MTANVLAAAIEKIGDYSLIVCGEGAADTYAHQIGPALEHCLTFRLFRVLPELN